MRSTHQYDLERPFPRYPGKEGRDAVHVNLNKIKGRKEEKGVVGGVVNAHST